MYKRHIIEKTIRGIGFLILLVGLVALYYAPLEVYCFYMFSKSGTFAYEGFQMGSFLFAILFIHSITYYILAIILIPLGIGTIKLNEWAHKITICFIYVWISFGISLLGSVIFSRNALIEKELLGVISIIGLVALLFIIIPFIMIKFYKNDKVIEVFKEEEHKRLKFINKYPLEILIIGILNIFFILFLHILIFFRCIFPVFGTILLGRQSMHVISLGVFIIVILTYGLFSKEKWGLWGLLLYYIIFLISWVLTFYDYSSLEIIKVLNYSDFEYKNIIARISKFISYFNVTVFISLLIPILLVFIWRAKDYLNDVKKN